MNTHILRASLQFSVKRFTGILSTCIYPDTVENYPMKEEDMLLGPPAQSNFSYGYAKRCMAVQIDAYNKQYGTDFRSVMPTNLYGINDNFHSDNSHVIPALMSRFHKAKINNDAEVVVWGTG